MSDRPPLNLAQSFTRGNDLFIYNFDEKSNMFGTQAAILRAHKEGFTCFQFNFKVCDRRGKLREFQECIALPHAAGFDERDAMEMAEEQHLKFQNTVNDLLNGH